MISMWGIFIGAAIGAAQILALKALLSMMNKSGSTAIKLLAVLLIMLKIAVIALILYLLSTVSLGHVIWAAGGMLIGLMTVSIIIISKHRKPEKDEHSV